MEKEVKNAGWLEELIHETQTAEKEKEKEQQRQDEENQQQFKQEEIRKRR